MGGQVSSLGHTGPGEPSIMIWTSSRGPETHDAGLVCFSFLAPVCTFKAWCPDSLLPQNSLYQLLQARVRVRDSSPPLSP